MWEESGSDGAFVEVKFCLFLGIPLRSCFPRSKAWIDFRLGADGQMSLHTLG